jgi:hypothetical protein
LPALRLRPLEAPYFHLPSTGGGDSKPGEQIAAKFRHGAGKIQIFSPEEAKLKQDNLHIRRELEREAAYEESCYEELCPDLAGKFARESARETGDTIGDIRDRYEAIVIELVCARSGGALIHDDAADPLTLEKLGQWLYAATKAPAGYEVWPELRRMPERRALLRILAQEYARDRETLMKFLRAVFERHCKIDEAHGTWAAKLCTQQLAAEYAPKQIAIELERRGIVPEGKTVEQFGALRARVRQYLNRS